MGASGLVRLAAVAPVRVAVPLRRGPIPDRPATPTPWSGYSPHGAGPGRVTWSAAAAMARLVRPATRPCGTMTLKRPGGSGGIVATSELEKRPAHAVDVHEEPSAEWGWHGTFPRATQVAGWFSALVLV